MRNARALRVLSSRTEPRHLRGRDTPRSADVPPSSLLLSLLRLRLRPGRRCLPLLPPVEALRETSVAVGAAVAEAARAEGVAATFPAGDLVEYVRSLMWQPVYRPVRPA